MKLEVMTKGELSDHLNEVIAEQERRQKIANIPGQMGRMNADYLAAEGVQEGDAWVQPTGAHNAYPQDWTVVHDGKTWVSLTPANVWEPGISAWREGVADGGVPEWIAPTGAHDAYQKGDTVTFNGDTYESLIDANTYSPTDYPAGWTKG